MKAFKIKLLLLDVVLLRARGCARAVDEVWQHSDMLSWSEPVFALYEDNFNNTLLVSIVRGCHLLGQGAVFPQCNTGQATNARHWPTTSSH